MRELYVSQLNNDLQKKIKDHLTKFYLNELELNEDEIKYELELAMNSRVNDLEDTIDIKKILQQV